jgi:hypothetical protein
MVKGNLLLLLLLNLFFLKLGTFLSFSLIYDFSLVWSKGTVGTHCITYLDSALQMFTLSLLCQGPCYVSVIRILSFHLVLGFPDPDPLNKTKKYRSAYFLKYLPVPVLC